MSKTDPESICPKSRFEKNVQDHEMTIIRDDGVHRHVEFRHKSGCSIMYFGVITWPGQLHFYGDMGSYSFQRLNDMFEFFRRDDDYPIDYRYWAEKLTSVNRSAAMGQGCDGVRRWSPENFKRCVTESFQNFCENNEIEGPDRQELWDGTTPSDDEADDDYEPQDFVYNVVDDVLRFADEGPSRAIQAALDMTIPGGYRGVMDMDIQVFPEFWDWGNSLNEYDYNFIWCCRALQWAVKQYDAVKQPQTQETHV